MERMWTVLLLILLFGTAVFFALLYFKSRRKEKMLTEKLEDLKKQSQTSFSQMDAVFQILNDLHDFGPAGQLQSTKSELGKMVVEAAVRITNSSAASLMLLNKQSNQLAIVSTKGMVGESMGTQFKVGEGIAGRVAESGKMILVENIDTDSRFIKSKGVEYRSKSMMSIPLKVKNKVIGVLNIHATEAYHPFSEREIYLLKILASQAAITLENWNLHESLHQFYLEMAETLARLLEIKEKKTEQKDSLREIRTLVQEITGELKLPETVKRFVELATIIHGIGKIAIDDGILSKPTRLSLEEYEQVKKYPLISKEMISQVQFLSPVVPLILYHQERWDGTGYPAGLKGEEIPLGARIVSVLAAYQAMTNDRPYRPALSRREAIQELKNGAGTQFDPKIVDVFVKILEKNSANQKGINNEQNRNEEQSKKFSDIHQQAQAGHREPTSLASPNRGEPEP